MTFEVVQSLVRNDISLDDQPNMRWKCGPNFIFEERVMRAGEQNRINFRVNRKELFHVLFHEETRPLGTAFAIFHQRYHIGQACCVTCKSGKKWLISRT